MFSCFHSCSLTIFYLFSSGAQKWLADPTRTGYFFSLAERPTKESEKFDDVVQVAVDFTTYAKSRFAVLGCEYLILTPI